VLALGSYQSGVNAEQLQDSENELFCARHASTANEKGKKIFYCLGYSMNALYLYITGYDTAPYQRYKQYDLYIIHYREWRRTKNTHEGLTYGRTYGHRGGASWQQPSRHHTVHGTYCSRVSNLHGVLYGTCIKHINSNNLLSCLPSSRSYSR
jgi:hypothetical protein